MEKIEVILYFREDNAIYNHNPHLPINKRISLLKRIIDQLKKNLNTPNFEYVVKDMVYYFEDLHSLIDYTKIYELLQPTNNNKVVLLTNVDVFCRNLDPPKVKNFESWEAEYKKLTDSLNEIERLIEKNHNKHIISEPELLRLTASKSFYNKGSLKKLTLPTITCKQKKATNGGMEYTISYNIKPSNKNVSGQNFQRLFNEENVKNEKKVNNNKKINGFTNKNISNFSKFFNNQNRNISGNNLKKLFNQNLLSERLYIIKKAYTSANNGIKIGVKKDELIQYINALNRYSFSSTFYIQELIRNVLEFKFYVFKGEIIYYMINDFFDDINKVITKNKRIEVPHYAMFPKNFNYIKNTWQPNSGYSKNRLIEKIEFYKYYHKLAENFALDKVLPNLEKDIKFLPFFVRIDVFVDIETGKLYLNELEPFACGNYLNNSLGIEPSATVECRDAVAKKIAEQIKEIFIPS